MPNSGQGCGEDADRWGQPPTTCGSPVDNVRHGLWTCLLALRDSVVRIVWMLYPIWHVTARRQWIHGSEGAREGVCREGVVVPRRWIYVSGGARREEGAQRTWFVDCFVGWLGVLVALMGI